MLIVRRNLGQRIRIELRPEIDPRTPVGEVLSHLDILVASIQDSEVRFVVDIGSSLILREK